MSALELLEATVQSERHALAHEMAKVMHRRVEELLREGHAPEAVYGALDALYLRYRQQNHAVERDAVAEVMDWFDGEGLLQPA